MYRDLQIGFTNGNNIGLSNPGGFSSSPAVGDMFIRSLNNLLLQCGGCPGCVYASKIGTNN